MAKHINKTIISSFQYQIFSNADSRFLMPLEGASGVGELQLSNVDDKFKESKTNEEVISVESTSEELAELKTESESKSKSEEVSVKSIEEKEVATSFKDMLSEFSSDEKEVIYGQNIVSFDDLEVPENYVGIDSDRWVKIPIKGDKNNPKILFLGDPDSEGLLNTEEEYEGEKFDLLIKIAKATNIPLREFGFINCIDKGQGTFTESPRLGGLLTSLKSEYIVTLGAGAYQFMTGNRARLSSVHGKTQEIIFSDQSNNQRRIKILPTFHPQYILINPSIKKTVWSDFQKLIETFSAQ